MYEHGKSFTPALLIAYLSLWCYLKVCIELEQIFTGYYQHPPPLNEPL